MRKHRGEEGEEGHSPAGPVLPIAGGYGWLDPLGVEVSASARGGRCWLRAGGWRISGVEWIEGKVEASWWVEENKEKGDPEGIWWSGGDDEMDGTACLKSRVRLLI